MQGPARWRANAMENKYEDKKKKTKLRWPKFIILDFLSFVRKFCVKNLA
jgi:hypothetical protein